jgi:tRNA pseudouridine38-40 synthase
MVSYRLKIAYDGTHYCGWQVQPNGVSVQSKIQDALKVLLKADVTVIGSGRTDAGVHALGQVAHFRWDAPLDSFRFLRALNSLLPFDIRITEMDIVPDTFHAQYSALGKEYHYRLALDKYPLPFDRLYRTHVTYTLDFDLMRQASCHFLGTHDFTAFANQATEGTAAHDPVRTITRVDLVEEAGGVRFEFEGDGFLYKMVRTMMGTLIEVGRGKRPVDDIPRVLASKDRRLAGIAAPPQGLFLVRVDYELAPSRDR